MNPISDFDSQRYRYTAFGLLIDSQVALPELAAGVWGAADVSIVYGKIPDKLISPIEQGDYYQAADKEFLFRVEGVAGYYVTDGRKIVVQPDNGDDLRELRLYLLGTAMGVLLMQRDVLPIHGSAVVVNGMGMVFTGWCGAGKSTLAAVLHKSGYSLLADDISASTVDEGGSTLGSPGISPAKTLAGQCGNDRD